MPPGTGYFVRSWRPPRPLPAPPERVLDWLDGERAFARTRRGRIRDGLRALISRALNIGR